MIWFALVGCSSLSPIDAPSLDALSPTERARVELGRALFFDPALSADGTVSCATCHAPEHFGAEPLQTSVGVDGTVGPRNAPSVLNARLKNRWFWDGRASSLEEQAFGPLYAEAEMAQTEEGLAQVVRERYAVQLQRAFDAPFDVAQVGEALAAFQRTLASPGRFDRYLQGEATALSPMELEGEALFREHCTRCHDGPGVGGRRIEKLGRFEPWPDTRDQGRFEVTGDPRDRMRFVVPSLRNVTRTGPWFHDGSVDSLPEAVRLMGRHQVGRTFTETEVTQLVAFLGTLEAEQLPSWFNPIETP